MNDGLIPPEQNGSSAHLSEPNSIAASNKAQPEAVASQMIKGRFALVVVALMVILADFTVYKSEGFAGLAAFLAGASILLCVGIPSRSIRPCSVLLWIMLGLAAYRLAHSGNGVLVFCGFWLLFALTVAFRRQTPFLLETLGFAAECIPGGFTFFHHINDKMRDRLLTPVDQGKPMRVAEFAFPVISLVLFGGVFVMANPDMVNLASGTLGDIANIIRNFFFRFSPVEVLFWAVVALLTGGLLRPLVNSLATAVVDVETGDIQPANSPLYSAFRNTLITLIGLFLVYLVFESRAFLSRKPPEGFTYSSYAHEGAAWLTVALGMATITLSLIFRGLTLRDSRLQRLQTLAWIWTALNFALAIAVYNRMWIYIDYNGMTRMRTVALLGISSVVAGFVLVVFKLQRQRSFWWLVQRQMWVLGVAVFLYAVLPVDVMIHRFNVRQVLAGNKAPVVQITAHRIDDEALPVLLPLCKSDDEMVASGIQSMLSTRFPAVQQKLDISSGLGWTARQGHRSRTLEALQSARKSWDVFESRSARDAAWSRLSDYAFRQWW